MRTMNSRTILAKPGAESQRGRHKETTQERTQSDLDRGIDSPVFTCVKTLVQFPTFSLKVNFKKCY